MGTKLFITVLSVPFGSNRAVEISACCQQPRSIKNAVCFLAAKHRVVRALHHAEDTVMREELV